MAQKTLREKLRLKENHLIATLNAPKNFQKAIEPLPRGVKISKGLSKKADFIYWFVKTQKEMEMELPQILKAMKEETIVWIFFPKGTSGIQTDLTRDKGWENVMKRDDLSWVSMISYDETWTAVAFRNKTEKDRKRESRPVEREIFKWADSKTKTLKLPDDVAEMLDKNKRAKEFFNGQSFSHRREYVEWIITAKREETRRQRLEQMVERLLKEYKNPAGRS